MTRRAGGFTLVEAIVALTLTSVLVVLVATTFLVQNRYYAIQLARTTAQDNARMVTEMVASELRSLPDSAVVVAANRQLVVRSPMVMAVVCAQVPSPARITVQMDGGEAALTTAEVTGFGVRESTGRWSYHDITGWSRIASPSTAAAATCYANGADTVGIRGDFQILTRINSYYGSWPPNGTVMMLYRTVEYRIQASTMDPSTLGLFRGLYGGTLVELATGLDSSSGFLYRTGGASYATSVSGAASLGQIDAVRIVAQARTRPQAGGAEDVTYGWAVNVHLRNGR
ncbi:MAG: PilW family protein [Longimicrobiales bacterium]